MRASRPTSARLQAKSSHALLLGGLLVVSLLQPTSRATAQTKPGGPPPEKPLRIFAAADLAPAMPALAQNYERQTGFKVEVVVGPSDRQVARIEAGEHADLFLGTDFTYPEKLVADGLTDAKAPIAYAKGTLVLLARKDSVLQPLSLERLDDPNLKKLAIPNPLEAPFGRAAAAALVKFRSRERLEAKFVSTSDSVEAAQMVESGSAQLGFVSLSVAKSERYRRVTSYAVVPQSQYPEIEAYAVVLRSGTTAAAHRFLDWILSSGIQAKLPNIGLDPVR